MTRRVSVGEFWLGLEGAALLRTVVDGDDVFITARIEAMRALVNQLDGGSLPAGFVPELDLDAGYESWAPTYDDMSNALIESEEPLVDAALEGLPTGDALDAACGTGRIAARLDAAGHRTIGVDRSDAMLSNARSKLPHVEFRQGELTALPVDSASMDVVTCGLALTHLLNPALAIAELARVVRSGGRIVLSDAHPTFVLIQGQAMFSHEGGLAFVRNHVHLHSDYLRTFRRLGLEVLDCTEAPMKADFTKGITAGAADAAAALWADIPVALVWKLERP